MGNGCLKTACDELIGFRVFGSRNSKCSFGLNVWVLNVSYYFGIPNFRLELS